jgi:23S rRNA (adenine2503-C2)-methyltransferase
MRAQSTLALQALTAEMLAREICARTTVEATAAECRKFVGAVHRERLALPMPRVRRVVREAALSLGEDKKLEVIAEEASALDPFRKLLFAGHDGARFEAVRIPLEKKGRFSVCVSSQVGCALACAFCATGRMGLSRNLEVWEIVEQVRAVRRTLAFEEKIHGVVFQGMGEPLANLDRVLHAIEIFSDPSAQAIDSRNITVCTSGIPSGILRLAKEAPNVRLGLSIGTALAGKRRSLMPIDDAHPLEEVMAAASEHARITTLSPMWAVTLLRDVNDSPEDGRALASLAKKFRESSGHSPRISVIPYNAIDVGDKDPFTRTTPERETAFREAMRNEGIFSHKRYSGGGDVAAACGQLAARS